MLTIENHKHSVEIASSGQPLLRYRVETSASKPHFDLVALPPAAGRAGENIVLAAPHDHVWHLGLFFAPGCVDGRNFWESELMASRGELYGECRHAGGLETAVDEDGSVSFSHDIRWRTNEDETYVRERRHIVVHAPVGDGYRIDWKMTWTAVGALRTMTSTPHDDAGLSYRCPRSMNGAAVQVRSSEGANQSDNLHGRPARWADLSGKLDGNFDIGKPDWAGLTLMDHPANPDHPVKWCCAASLFGFLAANPTFGRSLTLDPDRPVTMQFGVLVHAGPANREIIESEYHSFAS